MNVSLVGLGHIGKAVVGILNENHGYFKNKFGSDINVISVSDSRTTIYNKKGLNLDKVLMYKERKELDEAAEVIKIDDIYSLPSDIIVDMSPATKDGIAGMRMYKNAFESGKHIVTSNKAPLALHWKEIMESSVAHKKHILYESAVGGGVPSFKIYDSNRMSFTTCAAVSRGPSCFSNTVRSSLLSVFSRYPIESESIAASESVGFMLNIFDSTTGFGPGIMCESTLYISPEFLI